MDGKRLAAHGNGQVAAADLISKGTTDKDGVYKSPTTRPASR